MEGFSRELRGRVSRQSTFFLLPTTKYLIPSNSRHLKVSNRFAKLHLQNCSLHMRALCSLALLFFLIPSLVNAGPMAAGPDSFGGRPGVGKQPEGHHRIRRCVVYCIGLFRNGLTQAK